jgi:hypothetical protein
MFEAIPDTGSRLRADSPLERGLNGSERYFNEPSRCGWEMLVHPRDWEWMRLELGEDLRALAAMRTGRSDFRPLLFDCGGCDPEDWWAWIHRRLLAPAAPGREPPFYILILGDPQRIPFGFQMALQAGAAVGRVHFDTAEEYRAYFRKLLARRPGIRGLDIFAPCHDEATEIAAAQFAIPLADWAGRKRLACRALIDARGARKRATRAGFEALGQTGERILFATGHGFFEPRSRRAELIGALCCPRSDEAILDPARDLISTDLIGSAPCFPGSIVVMQSCYGFGMPSESALRQRCGMLPRDRREDRISALPRKWLANPRGPIAFVGHLDMALVFTGEADDGYAFDPLVPFTWLIEAICLRGHTVGYAMSGLRRTVANLSNLSLMLLDKHAGGKQGFRGRLSSWVPSRRKAVAEKLMRKKDAGNLFLFGDPAAA